LAGAREELEKVRLRLLRPTPEAFESSVPILESAVVFLHQVESALRLGNEQEKAPVHFEIGQLRRELARVNALARQAAMFYQVRAQLLNPADNSGPNYTSAGIPSSGAAFDRTVVIHG
jgi:hypothetical protein